MKLKDKAQSATHRVVVYGPPKCGKSALAGKLAQYFKLVWLDFENGHAVLYQLPEAWQENIELIEIPDTKTFPIGIQTALKIVTGAKMSICHAHGNVACALCASKNDPSTEIHLNSLDTDSIVVFDSLTQISNSAMSHITKNKPDDYKPDWEDYRTQGALMDKFLSQIQQAKYNVICITHEAEVTMEDKTTKLVPVAGTTNFSRNTAKYFDDVVYGRVANRKHSFSSSSVFSNQILTGSRTNVIIEADPEPTLLRIFKPEILPPVPVQAAGLAVVGTPIAPSPGTQAVANLAAMKAKLGL